MSSTPAPIFNPRKRPRQSLIADPQSNCGTFNSNPGPSGAAIYNDLMPPGGFPSYKNQAYQGRNNTPTSGHGAAFNSRQTSYGAILPQTQQSGVSGQYAYSQTTTANKQNFSNNNGNQQQPQTNRPYNQGINNQRNQTASGGQQWNRTPGTYQQQSNSSYPTQQQSLNAYPTQQSNSGNQQPWFRNTGNPVNNNNNNNNRYGANNNMNDNNNKMNYTNNTMNTNNRTGTNNNNNKMNYTNNNISNNNNQRTYKQTQLPWSKTGGTTGSNTGNPRCTGQNTQSGYMYQPGNTQCDGGNGGSLYRSGQMNSCATKMVAASGSGYLSNQQGNSSYFNKSQGPVKAAGQIGPNHQIMGGMAENVGDMDEWDTSFDDTTSGMSQNPIKEKLPRNMPNKQSPQDRGIHLLTVNVSGIKRWSKFRDTFSLLFEMFGTLDSAVTKSATDCKEFILRDGEKNTIKCVFFEIEIQIPKMTRGMPYRVVGTYDRANERVKCSSVRAVSDKEKVQTARLTAICTKAMCNETRGLREN